MRKLQRLGNFVFWLTFVGIWLVLVRSKRTRLAIFHNNELLVVKSWLGNGKWSLPGGGIHKGESATHAVIREVQEEVGINLSNKQIFHKGNLMYRQDDLRFSYDLFTADVTQKPDIHLNRREIIAAEWVDYSQLTKRNSNDDVVQAVRLAK